MEREKARAVRFLIQSAQTGGEGKRPPDGRTPEDGRIRTEADGTIRRSGAAVLLSYDEGEGTERTTTEIRVERIPAQDAAGRECPDRAAEGGADPIRVTVRRRGAADSLLIFEEGREHAAEYRTPYGSLDLSVRTERIRWTDPETTGHPALLIDYELLTGGRSAAARRFFLKSAARST